MNNIFQKDYQNIINGEAEIIIFVESYFSNNYNFKNIDMTINLDNQYSFYIFIINILVNSNNISKRISKVSYKFYSRWKIKKSKIIKKDI